MKRYCILKLLFVLIVIAALLAPGMALCAGSVPQEVLDSRESLVRIVVGYEIDGEVYSGCGTGFAIGTDSPVEYIATNNHVIEGDPDYIRVFQSDTVYTEATVYKNSEYADLAILKLDKPIYDVPPIPLEDIATPETGDAIYALGYPAMADYVEQAFTAGVDAATVTDGIIGAVKEGYVSESSIKVNLIQINATINGGNSGGPLVNENGYAIGINSFSVEDMDGIYYAVGVSELIPMLESSGIAYLASSDISDQATEETLIEAVDESNANEEANSYGNAFGGTNTVLVIIAVVALAAGGVLLFLLLRKRGGTLSAKQAKGVAFEAFFNSPYISTEQKLYALVPLAKQVQYLHANGVHDLDICPQNISVSGNVASLRLNKKKANDNIVIRPGYSPIEQYGAGNLKGTWTDVYALCAVLYTVLTGSAPPEAYTRGNTDVTMPNGMDKKYASLVQAITVGLAVDVQRRSTTAQTLVMLIQSSIAGYQYGLDAIPQPMGVAQPVQAQAVRAQAPPQIPAEQPDTDISRNMQTEENKVDEPKQTQTQGLSADRPPEVVQSASEFQTPSQDMTQQMAQPMAQPSSALGNAQRKKKLIIAGIAVGAVLAVFFGWLLLTDMSYTKAMAYADGGQYAMANENLQGVPGFYAQSSALTKYTAAYMKLENGEYSQASEAFAAAGDFQDAQEMAKEAAYLYGKELLESGDKEAAQEVFASISGYKDADSLIFEAEYAQAEALIAEGQIAQAEEIIAELRSEGYTEADELLKEINYVEAVSLIEAGSIGEALTLMETIGGYKDVDTVIETTKKTYFEEAVSLFDNGELAESKAIFTELLGYDAADDYIRACELIEPMIGLDWWNIDHDDYEELEKLSDSVDITHYMLYDGIIFHFIDGEWEDANGNYFIMEYDAGDDAYYPYSNLDTSDDNYYDFLDGMFTTYETMDQTVGRRMLEFTVEDMDTVSVKVVLTAEVYQLKRN